MINSVKYSIKCRSLNKREHGGEAQRGVHMKLRSDLLCFLFCFFFPVIYHRSGLHNRILPTMFFSPVEILLPEYQRLGSAFFHPPFPLSFQPLISPSYPPPHRRIFSVISHLLSFAWFHPPTMGVKITF